MKKAIYAFSGDPITLGHLDIIERAASIFDGLIVAIGVNPSKKYLFTLEERAQMAKAATAHIPNSKVIYFHGLLVDYAYENNISTIIRGLRNSEDFNFEILLHQIGESQKMNIETFFIPAKQELSHISSGAVKAIQLEQGLIHDYVPLNVKQKLEARLSGQFIAGVTGEICAGKSYLCEQLKEAGKLEGIEVHRIDIDEIGHDLLERLQEPLFVKLRQDIAHQFGAHLLQEDGFINSKELGKIIFNDINQLAVFNRLIYLPLLLRLRRALYGKKGIILLDSALIAESQMSYLCNNHIVLVKTSKEEQLKRFNARDYTKEQVERKLASQYTYELKRKTIEQEIKEKNFGKIYSVTNENLSVAEINSLFKELVSEFSSMVKV